jgi:ElaB/YqjD/DUF883 family membrane-anchored ribosome-binding protein
MAWLDRIEDRRTQRLLHDLRHQALAARDLAQDRLSEFARDAGGIARHAAHDVADYGRGTAHDAAHYGRQTADDFIHSDGAQHAREAARYYARRAGELATQLADYGRQEGAVIAQSAAAQAARAGRAVKADPVPVIVGAIGVALLVNLLLGRRRG